MMKLRSKEMFRTSLGLKIVIDDPEAVIHNGDIVEIDGKQYHINEIGFPKTPENKSIILTVSEI